MTSALDGGVIVTPRPPLPPGKDPVSIVQESVWTPGPVTIGAKYLAPTGIGSPDLLDRSQSLYRLHSLGLLTLQTLTNLTLHYFIIIHSYPILFYIIFQNKIFNPNYILIFLILRSGCDTFYYYYILVSSTRRWPVYWSIHVSVEIINKKKR